MAQIYRQNGDAQPVFALDIQNGSTTATLTSTPALVQMAGPELQFIALIVENASNQAIDLRAELGNTTDPGVVQVINQAVQQTSTIAFYQVQPTTAGQISYGVYPTAGFADASSGSRWTRRADATHQPLRDVGANLSPATPFV